MRILIFCLLMISIMSVQSFAQTDNTASSLPPAVKVEANQAKGFAYPYYLFVPPELKNAGSQKHTILVLPNNPGKNDDSLEFHEADVKKRIAQNASFGSLLKVAILMPVFPRPATDWKIYTHALDRDSMLTDKKEYARFDLQLIAMIDDARERLKQENLQSDEKVLMFGFSASGMFVNRFAFLHPNRVKAAAIGSPGGWAIAPIADYKEKNLRYPIGTGDLKLVSGKKFDLKNLRKVPLFLFLGDEDDNDSVIYDDGYEKEDKELIFALFGKTPVERWEISKTLYKQAKMNAEFKLYAGVKHTISKEMREDLIKFLSTYTR